MNLTNLIKHGLPTGMQRATLCYLVLLLLFESPTASASHVGFNFDNTVPLSLTVSENIAASSFYGVPTIEYNSYAWITITGKLTSNQFIEAGKRAVELEGFSTDIILQEALAGQEIQPDPNQAPFWIQSFTLNFYSDPYHLLPGFDPATLLSGYSVKEFRKTFGNTCPANRTCAGNPDGSFDLTYALGNQVDTLRIGVISNPSSFFVPEPGSVFLLTIGLLALGVASPRRMRRAVTR